MKKLNLQLFGGRGAIAGGGAGGGIATSKRAAAGGGSMKLPAAPPKYTQKQLAGMSREKLVNIAHAHFIRNNVQQNGLSVFEAEMRFSKLVPSNSTPQLRKSIMYMQRKKR